MTTRGADAAYTGAIPQIYDTQLVPWLFEPYAKDLARRLASRPIARLLEIACGTGVVTRAMAATLPPSVSIVATDLNQAMVDRAAAAGTARAVEWRQADAMKLPFDDGRFDAVVCQFGAMFFPSRPAAFAEMRRVLKPGGACIFSVWDRISDNEFADEVTASLASIFPADPPRFLARTPHGYHDRATIAADVTAAGFTAQPRIETVTIRSRAASPSMPAIGFCQGTPLRAEIEARDPARLDQATAIATEAVARRFGRGEIEGKMQAIVVTVERT